MGILTVGVIGAGTIATTAHIPVLRAMPQATVAWVSDTDEPRGRFVARANSTQFAPAGLGPADLPQCDAIVLAIPPVARDPYFDYFAGTGTAVLAEKPLANDAAAHARQILRFRPWQLSVGYQRRHHASSRLLRSVIEQGPFGPLVAIRMNEGGRTVRTGGGSGYQDYPTARGGGVVKNLGCHSLDLALWMTAASGVTVHDRAVVWDAGTDRRAQASIELEGVGGVPGARCRLEWTVSWLGPEPNVYEFEFATAVIRCMVAPAGHVDLLALNGTPLGRLEAAPNGGALTSNQAFFLEWSDVLESLQRRSSPVLSAASALKTAEVMDEILAELRQ